MPARRSAIEKLVEAVPEVYQPVYGHPEFDDRVARRCDDRLAAIRQAIEALAPEGRRLRILDIGCSLGYVSLSLAADGHEVLGIDRQPANVALARALAAESGLAARFEVASLDESWLAVRDDGEFDLALALSVLHHTVHEKGLARTQRLVHRLLLRSRTVVAELALRREPLYWAASLPGDPLALFGRAAFVRELGRFETHLSGIRRPLVFASDRLALVAERTYAIERWSETAHEQEGGSHQSSRRYYFCEGSPSTKPVPSASSAGPMAPWQSSSP